MSIDDLKDLRLNQQVKVKCNPHIDGYYIGWVKSINDWTKTVGVVDVHDKYKEYPPRLILNC
mgnify:FL=1|jgi:hypothetical protein|tara:strand:- start:378 stop:563 length:186 start_codon:yes stop_codon:yes gene_type:complete